MALLSPTHHHLPARQAVGFCECRHYIGKHIHLITQRRCSCKQTDAVPVNGENIFRIKNVKFQKSVDKQKEEVYPIGNQRQRDQAERCAYREHADGGIAAEMQFCKWTLEGKVNGAAQYPRRMPTLQG